MKAVRSLELNMDIPWTCRKWPALTDEERCAGAARAWTTERMFCRSRGAAARRVAARPSIDITKIDLWFLDKHA